MEISTFTDDNGQEFQTAICPTCGNIAIRLESNEHGWFWRCMDEKCGVFLPDDDGQIAIVSECPECHVYAVARYACEAKPELHYHQCACCGGFFADCDYDENLPGEPFSADPLETTHDLRLTLLCSTVRDLEVRMAKCGMRHHEIRRRIRTLEREGYIALDPAVPGVGLSLTEPEPTGSYI